MITNQRLKSEELSEEERIYEALPMSTRELFLGVDVTIHAQRMYHEITGAGDCGGLSPGPEIHAVGSADRRNDLAAGSRNRMYLAAWARRNLFGGAKPGDNGR